MKEIYIEYDNIELTLTGNYTKGDASNYSYPGSDSCFDCHQVLCGGQDIINILEQNIIEDLELLAIDKIEEI
tara:strand:+ start:6681 stop:6896 length:216 start_codon:yes stop_codon:yes gene_type:complete